jgi:hypothetical protein
MTELLSPPAWFVIGGFSSQSYVGWAMDLLNYLKNVEDKARRKDFTSAEGDIAYYFLLLQRPRQLCQLFLRKLWTTFTTAVVNLSGRSEVLNVTYLKAPK